MHTAIPSASRSREAGNCARETISALHSEWILNRCSSHLLRGNEATFGSNKNWVDQVCFGCFFFWEGAQADTYSLTSQVLSHP